MFISYQGVSLALSLSHPLELSFACISFKWLRIFLISAFLLFLWRGNLHVKHKFFIVLSLVLTWVPGTRRYSAVLLGIFYTPLPVGHGMTNWFYGSTQLNSTRLDLARFEPSPGGSAHSALFVFVYCLSFFFLYLLANFLLRALSFHFILLINLLEKLLFTASVHSDSVCRSQKTSLPVPQLLF